MEIGGLASLLGTSICPAASSYQYSPIAYAVVGGCALVVSCGQLRYKLGHSPFGDEPWWKAPGYWLAFVVLDIVAGIALLFVARSSSAGCGTGGGVPGWIGIGTVAVLGVRAPLTGERNPKATFDSSVTFLVTPVRDHLMLHLERRVNPLRTRWRDARTARALKRGWTAGTALVLVEANFKTLREKEKDQEIASVYIAATSGLGEETLLAIVEQLCDLKHWSIVDQMTRRAPTALEQARVTEAMARAGRVRAAKGRQDDVAAKVRDLATEIVAEAERSASNVPPDAEGDVPGGT